MGHEVMDDKEMSKSQIQVEQKPLEQIQVVVGGTSNECKPTSNHSSDTMLGKRKVLNGRIDSTCSLQKKYSNFMKSGPPKRILFHENGAWNDFPQGLVDLVREDFLMKKAVIKVQFNDITVMLDMVYMVQVDPITDTPKPIAWIDDSGSCYFPELYTLNAQMHQRSLNPLDIEGVTCQLKRNGAHEIKLHIGIDLNGLNKCNLEECIEESNVDAKRVKVEENALKDVHEESNVDAKRVKVEEENALKHVIPITDTKPENGAGNDNHTQLEPAYALLDAVAIQNLFHMGMHPFFNVSIIEITKCSSILLQMRMELFEKQVEITNKYRGNSNVQYAWVPCSKGAISSMNSCGLWHGPNERRIKYGYGIHLSAVNRASESANVCYADANGVYYMVFCRVILGNVEVVHPASRQWHPSSETFDSGVDNLENPSTYIIWHMNASTRISPEYVVSFKIPSAVEGSKGGEAIIRNNSGVAFKVPRGFWQFCNPSSLKGRIFQYQVSQKLAAGNYVIPSRALPPVCPSLTFSSLVVALADKISAKTMSIVCASYREFMSNRISKAEFIRKLRQVVSDEVMQAAIFCMHSKLPPK